MIALFFQQDFGACLFGIGALVILVVIIWASEYNKKAKRKVLADAKAAYAQYLVNLKADPNNPNLKQHTLQAGRYYSSLTRHDKSVTVFDEVALSNDINAACAGASRAPSQPKPSVKDRLAAIDQLMSEQVISPEEYQARRTRILDEL